MSRWFLPETPDVLGLLGQQIEVTIAGMDAFARWAAGEAAAQAEVRTYEHRADERKRELHRTLSTAFITPLEPEDLFALSRGIDRILDEANDTVRESEVMDCPPDEPFAAMAVLLAARGARARHSRGDARTRRPRHDRQRGPRGQGRMPDRTRLPYGDGRAFARRGPPRVMARRELYRRGSRIGEHVVDVAERVLYAAVKET